jgi:hypothetical protein
MSFPNGSPFIVAFEKSDKPLCEACMVFGLTAPDGQDLPPFFAQPLRHIVVPPLVFPDFLFPKQDIRRRQMPARTGVPMPKAPVDEHHASPGRKHKIRSSSQVFSVQPKTISEPVEH